VHRPHVLLHLVLARKGPLAARTSLDFAVESFVTDMHILDMALQIGFSSELVFLTAWYEAHMLVEQVGFVLEAG